MMVSWVYLHPRLIYNTPWNGYLKILLIANSVGIHLGLPIPRRERVGYLEKQIRPTVRFHEAAQRGS